MTVGDVPPGPTAQLVRAGLEGRDVLPPGRVAELGVELDKSETYTNWLDRPLSPAQLSYAAEDVSSLLVLADRLKEALAARGRLTWAAEASGG